MITKANQPILIVEDSPEDYEAILRAFKKSRFANPVYRCEDGDDALDYMYRRGPYQEPASSPRPGLILLDLNLPGTDGREFLTEIKHDSTLKRIPVIVLTTSCDQTDIDKCYEAGANSYICKPVSLIDLVAALQRLKEYWFEIVVFPKGRGDMAETIKLLIVDDSPEDRALYKRLVLGFGAADYQFVERDCGEEGLEFLENDSADCILLDYNLPDMDGIEVLESLAGLEGFDTPVIFLTGQGTETIAVQAMKNGADDYLVKTDITRELLNRSIHYAMEKKDSEKKLRHYVLELEKANHQILEQQKAVVEEERLKAILQMAGATAHEMNQPLMILLASIELLALDQGVSGSMKKHMERIQDAGDRLSDIVKRIQTIRRFETKPYAGGESIVQIDQS